MIASGYFRACASVRFPPIADIRGVGQLGRAMIGEMFKMESPCGRIFLHHVSKSSMGDVVAVHRRDDVPTTAEELDAEAFALLFPIGAAKRRGIGAKVGKAPVPPKLKLDRLRYPFHDRQGRLLYWVLVENGKERRGVEKLTREQVSYPIGIAVNDTALQELVCAGYDAETIKFR